MDIRVYMFLNKLETDLPSDSAILLLGVCSKENENTNLKRYMHPSVHSSIIYNNQDMEAI